jgi:hypothetical protein
MELPAGVKLVKMGDASSPTVVEVEGVSFNLSIAQMAAMMTLFKNVSETASPEVQPPANFLPAKYELTAQQAFQFAERWPAMTPKQRFMVVTEFGQEGGELILQTREAFFPDEDKKNTSPINVLDAVANGVEQIGRATDLAVKTATALAVVRHLAGGRWGR